MNGSPKSRRRPICKETIHCFTPTTSLIWSMRILPFAIILLGCTVVLLICGCGEAEQPPPKERLESPDLEVYLTNKVNATTNKTYSEKR